MSITESDAFAIVRQLIQAHLLIFQKHGFEHKEDKILNFSTGNILTIPFSNERTGIEVKLNFSYAAPGLNGGFIIYIINAIKNRMNVEQYLLLHGLVKERLLFTYTDNVPDFAKYCETFLSSLDNLFSGELKPILDGKKWEDIPFDWGDYK